MIVGSSGAAGNSIQGITAWNVNSNTGTVGGLNRANFPGRLSCPTINLGGQQIVPSTYQRALVLLGRAMGEDAEGMEDGIWYGCIPSSSTPSIPVVQPHDHPELRGWRCTEGHRPQGLLEDGGWTRVPEVVTRYAGSC